MLEIMVEVVPKVQSEAKNAPRKQPFRLHWGHVWLYCACMASTALVCWFAYSVFMLAPQFFTGCLAAAATSTVVMILDYTNSG